MRLKYTNGQADDKKYIRFLTPRKKNFGLCHAFKTIVKI